MAGKYSWVGGLLGLLVGGLAVDPARAQTEQLLAYVVLGPKHGAVARLITTERQCPDIVLGSMMQPMVLRVPASPKFPVLVCDTPIPPGTVSASVAGQALVVLPKAAPKRIVVLGDTGCRLKHGHPFQACNDTQQWPFAKVIESATNWRPDLVIHTGDYLYRELACPRENADCAGSPVGENWPTWRTDFFGPAAPLLRAAPWVMARGDHEVCSRGGEGFFRFLDPRPWQGGCRDETRLYPVDAGELRLIVMDTSNVGDGRPNSRDLETYSKQFRAMAQLVAGRTWLVMHKPIWGLRPDAAQPGGLADLNQTLQAASGNVLPGGIERVLSGHIHLFQVLSFSDNRPPQLVMGTGGTLLDRNIATPLAGRTLAGTTISKGHASSQFGFTTMEPSEDSWTVTLRDAQGVAQTICLQRRADISCAR